MRRISQAEVELITALVQGNPQYESQIRQLNNVVDLSDGGMGSIRFGEVDKRRFGGQIAEISVLDVDGVPVSFALNVDQEGILFELDVFKSDFSPLKEIPMPPYRTVDTSD